MAWRLRLVPEKTNINFFAIQWVTFGTSIFAMLASLVLIFTMGLNFGIDFKGGSVMEVSTAPRAIDLAKVRTTLEAQGLGDVQVQIAAEVALNYIALRAIQLRTQIASEIGIISSEPRFDCIEAALSSSVIIRRSVRSRLFRKKVIGLSI